MLDRDAFRDPMITLDEQFEHHEFLASGFMRTITYTHIGEKL